MKRTWYYRERALPAESPKEGRWRSVVEGCRTAEEYPTVFLVGRWIHEGNLITGDWFVLNHPRIVESPMEVLQRDECRVREITYDAAVKLAGRRAMIAMIEDLLGFRVRNLCRKLNGLGFGWIPAIKRGVNLDVAWVRREEFVPPSYGN